MSSPLTYRDAGVDIDAGDDLVKRIRPFAEKTRRPEVLSGLGGFGAMFELGSYRNPVLVSGADGVGTKLKLAFEMNIHDSVGQDLVAMNVNDILAQGAEPLYFLDYFACGKLHVDVAADVIKGIATGCELAGCALAGGETAEMPGMYPEGEYDLAGFAVGVVEKDAIVDGRSVTPGDIVIGLASSGLHSNGYSLARKVLEISGAALDQPLGNTTLGQALLTPTRIYVKPILALMREIGVKGMAHITGGGLLENIPRVLPESCAVHLDRKSWQWPAIFDWLQEQGHIADREMHRTFNCGIGFIAIVAEADAERAIAILNAAGEHARQVGRVVAREANADATAVLP